MSLSPRVLLIEDNEQNRYLATYLLENHGCLVTHAADGPRGVELALTGQFDLILLDIGLPLLDGHEVVRQLREVDALHATPIVAVTAYAMAGDRQRILAEGCDGYMEKPIDPETFVRDVMKFVVIHPSGDAP